MKQEESPYAWLQPLSCRSGQQQKGQQVTTTHRARHEVTRGLTVTMSKPGDFQNMLTAVPYPQKKTGFKDPADPCNRSDKRNGGDYRRFESSYSKQFCGVDDKPIQFREDGLPISARRIAGKPLMAPKMPNQAELTIAKRFTSRYHHQSSVCIGNPNNKDPGRFRSVYQIVHAAPHRALAQPNLGIAAADAARAHKQLGLFN